MFGAEVEDVLFVFVVLFVGVEGVYANSFYVRQVVDFDAFAVERVEAASRWRLRRRRDAFAASSAKEGIQGPRRVFPFLLIK